MLYLKFIRNNDTGYKHLLNDYYRLQSESINIKSMTSGVPYNSCKIPKLWPCFLACVCRIARGEVSLKKELKTQSQLVVQYLCSHSSLHSKQWGYLPRVSQKWFQISRKCIIGTQEISQIEDYKKDTNDIKILI